MNNKKLIQALGFLPKENTSETFQKKYSKSNNYAIEIDFEKEIINFGNKIKGESKTTQNFSQAENWVVLECVDRLLEKGYQPQNITLEKTWKTGHGTSGRLDILVSKEDSSAYLMIECKTWGAEFEKELKNLEKNGGQLFTYFQQDKNADVIMLYASKLEGKKVEYKNTIVKIEEDYRQAGNVKDFFERWNKLPKSNGVFDSWVTPYEFQSKALTKNDLKVLRQEDSSFIFNRFLEILRHNVVSDKPNAFNKIFTLFLCKIVDENRNQDDQLHFQWLEGEDNHISFQKRLTDLYNRGMLELLEKKVTDVSDSEFDKQFLQVESQYKDKFKEILTEIRLKKNNEFAIKEVYDDASFEENAKVVKEVVELLQVYQIRYNYRQQFLSDFFELLLTTGLKQESGQFFTPVPIARFIIKSLPFQEITSQKIEVGNKNDLLPTIIDYAAGSGHFITESMEVVQNYIDSLDESSFNPTTKRAIEKWKVDQFDWAESYVYGIEKDYRLVKTAKVSCYLHGDGLAKVIHGDGLGDFATSTEFKDLLKETDKTYPQDNKQFDVIISNPPYSVSAFKGLMNEEKSKIAFDLYNRLTDQSSEIECLFIERTKQLLKDGGVAGIILPSSILSNTGIYTQTREILLKHFEILGIAELGSNTFMATGTNTVTLFLRRRNNADAYNVEEAIKKCFVNLQDVTINGIEKPLKKYVAHVWDSISFEDYKTLLQKSPNKTIEQHEIYKEYTKKIKAKNETELWTAILAIEQDKLLYFILAYPQKLVLVKTGEKNEEKRFLGYEFSNRRGSEGIHAIQRSKSIDECTELYDADSFTNPEKASTYIYKAFLGEFDLELPENLKQNLSYHNLVDMFTFDRVDFEKNISLSAKKKIVIDSKFDQEKVENVFVEIKNGKNVEQFDLKGKYRVSRIETIADATFNLKATKWTNDNVSENDFLQKGDILLSHINSVSHLGKTALFNLDEKVVHGVNLLRFRPNQKLVIPKYISEIFKVNLFISEMQKYAIKAANQASINATNIKNLKIPLPPLDIQKKIVSEIEVLEEHQKKAVEEIEKLKIEIETNFKNSHGKQKRLDEVCELKSGNFVKAGNINKMFSSELYPCYGGNGLRGYTESFTNDGKFSLVGRQGALCGNVHLVSGKFHATEHALVAYPKEEVDVIWLHYQLVFMNLNQYATGTAQPGLSVMNLNPIEISVPTISEQNKIVKAIEKIETKISELEKNIADIPKQKEAILKKYL
ncbi:restriction endonuclease subunit S [Flavobacterium muglaense]|uniref:site-specific DNA-methyltransferase (adenine-specific) n=1 Tax=Flavobacterium muglaense TaxID=2764716 RepID=A0A923MY04_9FLAO|nr:restriction endonuclease subunit S [Flavobacterium muglaense]MBC5837844.1 restriction endonuclease subunit S [Flavobacterium muglaense]MBC5844398.1 restriction endonuclease subunit S [Flavobacterium muglaense]